MADVANETPAPSEPKEPEFELTPEILAYENRRNDYILCGGVVALAFFLAASLEVVPELWLHLRAGWDIARTFPSVPGQDSWTYTAEGRPWVNPHWLFDLKSHLIYENLGHVALSLSKILVVMLAAGAMLLIRHPGPTLWWTAVCATLALLAMSLQMEFGPETYSYLYLALLLALRHSSRRGSFGLIYLAIPLTALWANVSMSYVLAPVLFLLWGIGEAIHLALPANFNFQDRKLNAARVGQYFGLAALTQLAGALTPFGFATVAMPWRWHFAVLPSVPGHDRGVFGWNAIIGGHVSEFLAKPLTFADQLNKYLETVISFEATWPEYVWLMLFGLAALSFVLNARHFNVARLLVTLLALLLPLVASRYQAHSAILLAAVLCLNMQEIYLHLFGTETRISTGWLIWSQGGRAVTLLIVFLLLPMAFTGRIQNRNRFGVGILPTRYPEAAANWLYNADMKGRLFAFDPRSTCYLLWANPEIKQFIDPRWHVFAPETLAQYSAARTALNGGDPAAWRGIFNANNVNHLAITPSPSLIGPLHRMLQSSDWAAMTISDQGVVLARADAEVDKDLIAEHRILANRDVFRRNRQTPDPGEEFRYVSAPIFIDWIWPSRFVDPDGMFAGTILFQAFSSGMRALEAPGSAFLAISSLRAALKINPDHPHTNYLLGLTYQVVYELETRQFALGIQDALRRQREVMKAKRPAADVKPAAKAAPKSESAVSAPIPLPAGKAVAKEAGKAAAPIAADTKLADTSKDVAKQAAAKAEAKASEPEGPLQLTLSPFLLLTRHHQLASAYRGAVIAGDRDGQARYFLGKSFMKCEFFDAALTQFIAAERMLNPETFSQQKLECQQRILFLEAEVERRRERYNEIVAKGEQEAATQGMVGDFAVEKASLARQMGLIELALEELEKVADILGPEQYQALAAVVRLSLLVGEVEKASAALDNLDNPQGRGLFETGEFLWLRAQCRLATGQYGAGITDLELAVAQLRQTRVAQAVNQFDFRARMGFVQGTPMEVEQMMTSLDREAQMLVDLALMRIEAGEPKLALSAFRQALACSPRLGIWPVVLYYWKLIDGSAPAPPAIYDVEDEVARRFPKPAPSAEKGEPKPAAKGSEPPAAGAPPATKSDEAAKSAAPAKNP